MKSVMWQESFFEGSPPPLAMVPYSVAVACESEGGDWTVLAGDRLDKGFNVLFGSCAGFESKDEALSAMRSHFPDSQLMVLDTCDTAPRKP